MRFTTLLCLGTFLSFTFTPLEAQNTSNHGNKFEQLGTMLSSPNEYRGVDGAPGPEY